MSAKRTPAELRQLHGAVYAEKLEETGHASRLKRLLSHMTLRPSYEVADFACGTGALMNHVCPLVRSYTGVDFSDSMIRYANARKMKLAAANVRFECASVETFCDRHADTFDVAFALDFSEHVYDDDWKSILVSIRTALKKEGRLYLHTPNADFFLEKMKQHDFILRQSPEHIAVRTLDENVRLLQEVGFRISKAVLISHYNVLRLIHPISYVPRLGRYFKARIFIEAQN